jgi:hypothetical protein
VAQGIYTAFRGLNYLNLGMVGEQELMAFLAGGGFNDAAAFAQQAFFNAARYGFYVAIFQNDAVFDLAILQYTAIANAGERANGGVLNAAMLSNHDRASNMGVHDRRPNVNMHVARQLGSVVHIAPNLVMRVLRQYHVIGRQQVVFFAGVQPPAWMNTGMNHGIVINQALNGIGNFQLSASWA